MQVIKLLPGQTVLDISGQEIPVEDFDSLVCFLDEEKEEALDLLYEQYGEDYINSQLEKGMQMEVEHSSDREMQYTLARDHILEFVDYYDHLEAMEVKMGEDEDLLTADVSEDTLLESRGMIRESQYLDIGKTVKMIAKDLLSIPSLKVSHNDTLDYHNFFVTDLEETLTTAVLEGYNAGKKEVSLKENDYHNKPVAAKGLTSYRYEGPYGFIMIGARDVKDAFSEAKRSTSKVDIKNLQVWDDRAGAYVPVSLLEKKRS